MLFLQKNALTLYTVAHLLYLRKMKKVIGIFLIIVLAVQVFPVKPVGNLLMSNQIQEEIPHSFDSGISKKLDMKNDFYDYKLQVFSHSLLATAEYCILYSVDIPSNHSCDILVPPPNC